MSQRKLSITLPTDSVDAIEARVEAGLYGSTDDAMKAAVDALLREETRDEESLQEIRRQVSKSLSDPRPSLSSQEMREHLDKLYALHRR